MWAMAGGAGSPVITLLWLLATDHFGSHPLSRWSASNDVTKSAACLGATSARSGIWLR